MTQPWIAADRALRVAVWNRATGVYLLGQAVELDEAVALTFEGSADLNPDLNTALDNETANPLVVSVPIPIGQPDSTETAQTFGIGLALNRAIEVDEAGGIPPPRRFPLGQALENPPILGVVVDGAQPITRALDELVINDDPWLFWRLGDSAGSHVLLDSSGNDNDGNIPLSYGGGSNPVTLGNPSLIGDPDTSLKFESSRPGLIESDDDVPASDAFTVEVIIDPTAPDWNLQIIRAGAALMTIGPYTGATTLSTHNAITSFYMDGTGDDAGRTDGDSSTFTLPDGRCHVIFRYDAVDDAESAFGPFVPRVKVFVNDEFVLSHMMQDLETDFEVAQREVAAPLQVIGQGVVIDEFAYYLYAMTRTTWRKHITSLGDPTDVITDDDIVALGQAEEEDPPQAITYPSLQEVALDPAFEADDTFPWNFSGIYGAGYSSSVMVDGPELYWRLGEPAGNTTALDYSGHGHTGSIPAIYNPPSEPDTNWASLGYPGLVSGGDNALRFTTQLADAQGIIYQDNTFAGSANFALELIVRPWTTSYQVYVPLRNPSSGHTIASAYFSPTAGLASYPGVLMDVLDNHDGVGGLTQLQRDFAPTIGEPIHFVFQVAGTPEITIGTDPNRYRMEIWANGILVGDSVLADLPATYNFMTEAGKIDIAGYGVDIDEVAWYLDDLSPTRIAAHAAAMGTKVTLGQAVETDPPVMMGFPRTFAFGQAPEDPGPFDPNDPAESLPVQIIPEAAGRIRPFLRTQFEPVGQASETDTARGVTPTVEGSSFSGGTTAMGGTRVTFPPRRLVSR